jgi:thioesterase domain-containing protein
MSARGQSRYGGAAPPAGRLMDGKRVLTEEAVHQAVKRAWTETRASYGPTIEWADAGADSLDTLHRILSTKRWPSPEGLMRRRRHLLGPLRVSALERWRPLPYDAPTLLALSETSIASGSSHLWPRLCSNLNIVRLPGQHHEIFEPQALKLLTPAFLQAVKAAGTAAR